VTCRTTTSTIKDTKAGTTDVVVAAGAAEGMTGGSTHLADLTAAGMTVSTLPSSMLQSSSSIHHSNSTHSSSRSGCSTETEAEGMAMAGVTAEARAMAGSSTREAVVMAATSSANSRRSRRHLLAWIHKQQPKCSSTAPSGSRWYR
jgi:hypothetical protein